MTLEDDSPLPAFINFDYDNNGKVITVHSTDNSTQGTYNIKIKGAVPNDNFASSTFLLKVLPYIPPEPPVPEPPVPEPPVPEPPVPVPPSEVTIIIDPP